MNLYHILFLGAILCITGCSTKSPDTRAQRDTTRRGASTTTTSSDAGQPPPPGTFHSIPFDRSAVPKEYIYQGKLQNGAHWIDANGDNTLLIAQQITPPGNGSMEEASKQAIFAYVYATKNGTTKLLWKIQDQAENWCDQGDGVVSDIVVLDLDGDNVAENAFIYNIQGSCDVSPRPFKLMLHSGERKFAVRGTNKVNPNGTPVGGEKKFDPEFDPAPKEFRNYAIEMWAKYVR